MKVRTKIIGLFGLMIFVVSCILALFIAFNIGEMQKRGSFMFAELDQSAEESVRRELWDLADSIGNYVLVLETEIDRSMLNAARVLFEFDREKEGAVTLKDLIRIREDTGMSDLYLGGIDGVFTLSTEPEAIGISLFDIWEGYRMLVTGEADYLPSDIKVKVETGEIFKFTAIPRADNRGLLESALDAGAIEVYLQRLIENNKSIRSMNLFDISLMTLTSNHAKDVQPIYEKGSLLPQEASYISAFFDGAANTEIVMDKQNARIYYPVRDGSRVRYTLFIDLDTTGYFAAQNMVENSIAELVRSNTFLSTISLGTVLAALLIFAGVLSFLMNKLVRKLEEAIEDAKVASRSKSVFLSNMSHEMRTPMNAIIGMAAIGKKTENMEEKNGALDRIEDASIHLLGIINEVLDMAKIEANKLELFPIEYDFEKMLHKVRDLIKMRADEKKQELIISVDEKIPRYMVGDDQHLAQIIVNLLSNAVKFTPENGKIIFEASLSGETDGCCELCIEVSDNGIGIAKEKQEKLFDAFEQAESGTSREFGGTGLGLAITKRIVNLMEGTIRVESEIGKGAKFIVTVKAMRGSNDDNENRHTDEKACCDNCMPESNEFFGKRLLLAEDVEVNREILISLLGDTGLLIECAENGKEALEKIEAEPEKYDAVLMDIQMPKMDGLEATRRIRALPSLQGANLPIIAMTANVFKEDVEKCIAAGMDDHLGKPLEIDRILEKLRKYLKAQSC